jgi:hypothetical protein
VSGRRGIDHLVVAVEDLATARDRFADFGFCTTPLGRQPWGTANHLVQFPHNFIELVGVVDREALVPMSDVHFSFSAHNDRFLREREGLSMLVLSTDDARADAEMWRERGLHVYEPVHWSRKATLPDGSESTVAFTLTFVVDPLMPEIAFFSCQQHNPEAFWKPEYQVHANGATGITGVTLVSEQPAEHRSFLSALVDGRFIEEDADALSVETVRGQIRILSPRRFAARYPAASPEREHRGAVLMAASIEVPDLDCAAQCLEDGDIAFSVVGRALQIGDAHACGMVLELVEETGRSGGRGA